MATEEISPIVREALEDPELYSFIRLNIEIQEFGMEAIKNNLDAEIKLYTKKPWLLNHNYETPEHFLAYISAVKSYYFQWKMTGKLPE